MLDLGGSFEEVTNPPFRVSIPQAHRSDINREAINDGSRKHFIFRLHPSMHARIVEFIPVFWDGCNGREG